MAGTDEPAEDPSAPDHVPERGAPGEGRRRERDLTEYEPAPPATEDPG